jgi:tetratricopeptide (TPR) repeat protein
MPYKCFGILQRALWMQNALNWQHYAEFAESAYNKGSFEVADNLIRLALSCAASFADGDYRYISTLEHLGDVLVARSKAHDACENYTRAYNLLKKFHGLASLNALRLQIKYGRVLIDLGKLSEARSVLARGPKYLQLIPGCASRTHCVYRGTSAPCQVATADNSKCRQACTQ